MSSFPLILLDPVTQAENGTGSFHYNYFEDAYREEVVCDPKEAVLYREKGGGREFSNVLHAAMSLFDVMKPEEESSILNKDTTNARHAIGWINHLFLSLIHISHPSAQNRPSDHRYKRPV